jgi:uncharacterized protein YaiL (DUF2058 family)
MSSSNLKPYSNVGRKRSSNSLVSETESEQEKQGKELIKYKSEKEKGPEDEKAKLSEEKARESERARQLEETPAEQARRAAAAAVEAVKASISIKRSTTGEGDNNFIGADESVVENLAKLEIENSHTKKGNGNFIGVGKSGNHPSEGRKSRSSLRR